MESRCWVLRLSDNMSQCWWLGEVWKTMSMITEMLFFSMLVSYLHHVFASALILEIIPNIDVSHQCFCRMYAVRRSGFDSMARTKQTATKSTGGKGPRMRLFSKFSCFSPLLLTLARESLCGTTWARISQECDKLYMPLATHALADQLTARISPRSRTVSERWTRNYARKRVLWRWRTFRRT